MMQGVVVVFDFDRSLIEDDSDRWVMTEMGLIDLFNQLRYTLPWNSLMDRMMEELHLQGKTIEDIIECLRSVPLHPRVIAAIKSAHAHGCDLKVMSDANQFYIETILKHHGVFACFSEIITNPTIINEEGRLRIFPYHDFILSPHGCNLCPPNLCKGLVIERLRSYSFESEKKKKKYVYIGDGYGDFCPSLKLYEGDCLLPRRNFPLWECICKNRSNIKADIHEWGNGEELERVLSDAIPINANM